MNGNSGIWRAIAAALWRNRWPCLLLNALVVMLVWSYYRWPPATGWWQAVAALKSDWSYGFSLVSTIIAAAILPTVIQWMFGDLPQLGRLRRLSGLILFWGYRGMEIDLLYRLQARLFGGGHGFRTLATKVAVDQFVYSAIWAVPTYAIALRWVDCGCSWAKTRQSLDRQFWTHTYPAILVTNWLVWIPTVALVYSLPLPLQFPLFSIVMCFFVLLVTLMASTRQDGGSRSS